jgi:hypothetical protein
MLTLNIRKRMQSGVVGLPLPQPGRRRSAGAASRNSSKLGNFRLGSFCRLYASQLQHSRQQPEVIRWLENVVDRPEKKPLRVLGQLSDPMAVGGRASSTAGRHSLALFRTPTSPRPRASQLFECCVRSKMPSAIAVRSMLRGCDDGSTALEAGPRPVSTLDRGHVW